MSDIGVVKILKEVLDWALALPLEAEPGKTQESDLDTSVYFAASVKEAELITYKSEPQNLGLFAADVIDSRDEIEAFRKTAYEKIDNAVKNSDLPDVEGKRAKLLEIYQRSEGDACSNLEKCANNYWQKLVAVVEKEKRASLTFDEKLIETLNLPEGTELIEYRKLEGGGDLRYNYEVKVNGIKYDINFYASGKIELFTYGSGKREDTFFRSATGYVLGEDLTKNVSLSDLKRLSTFDIFCAHHLDPKYPDTPTFVALNAVSVLNLPVRSTDPVTSQFIELDKEFRSLYEELAVETKKEIVSRERYDELVDKLGGVLAKFERLSFDVLHESGEDQEVLKKMISFRQALARRAEQAPSTAYRMVEEARYKEELEFLDGVTCPNFRAKLNARYATLPSIVENEFKKYDGFKRLDKEHKKAFIQLVETGWRVKDVNSFLKAFAIVPKAILSGYVSYVAPLNSDVPWNKGGDKDARYLIRFTKATAGMDPEQFSAYSEYYRQHNVNEYPRSTEEMAKAVKGFKKYDDLKLVKIFLADSSISVAKMKETVARAKKLVPSRMSFDELSTLLSNNSNRSAKALFLLEKLDADYIKNWLQLLVENLPNKLGEIDFKLLNSLKQYQREVLHSLKGGSLAHAESKWFNSIIKKFSAIHNEYEAMYLEHTLDANSYYFEECIADAASHSAVWLAMEEANIPKNMNFGFLAVMFSKNIPDDVIIKSLEDVSKLHDDHQVVVFRKFVTAENACELAKELVLMKDGFDAIRFDKLGYELFAFEFGRAVDYKELLAILNDLKEMHRWGRSPKYRLARTLAYKTENIEDVKRVIGFVNDKEISTKIADIAKRTYKNITDENDVIDLINIYFYLMAAPKNLPLDANFFDKLQDFIEKADEEKYDLRTDPGYVKAGMLLDGKNGLEAEDTSENHISYILNILQNSSEKYSAENVRKAAIEMLEDESATLREKGAKLLVGQGNIVQNFGADTVRKIAKEGVDEKLTQYKISEKITDSQLEYLSKATSPIIPLSLYFSFLITMEKSGRSGDQKEFERLVLIYDAIKDKPVFAGELLALSYNVYDSDYSFISSVDAFSTEAYEIFARDIQGLPSTVLRHAKDGENVESMFSMLEMKKGALTIVIGGHGGPGTISYGSERFTMDRFFESLAKRVADDSTKEKWPTTIIFESCYSDTNARRLNEMWKNDERTKGHPVIMISSSNENSTSAKMAGDAWTIAARKFKQEHKVLTYEELYKEIESRSFIMTKLFNILNSNMTVFINGEEVG